MNIAEAVPLGYAMVARVARDAGVRALAIKGPISEYWGFGSGKSSVDIDILISPDDVDFLVRPLNTMGWHVRPSVMVFRVLPPHSLTLRHELWPCEIDLHFSLPGVLCSADRAFEAFWQRRSLVQVAGIPLYAVSAAASALIAVYNSQRDDAEVRQEFGKLAEQLAALLTHEVWRDIDLLTAATSSQLSAEPLYLRFERSAPNEQFAPDADLVARWRLQSRSRDNLSGVGAMYALKTRPVSAWPRIAWQAVMIERQELEARGYPVKAAAGSVAWFRGKRLLRGIRNLRRSLDSATGQDT